MHRGRQRLFADCGGRVDRERALQRASAYPRVELFEPSGRPGRLVAVDQGAALDYQAVEADGGRRAAADAATRPIARWRELPIAPAVGQPGELDHRRADDDMLNLDLAAQ